MRLLKCFVCAVCVCLFAPAGLADTYQLKVIGVGGAQGFLGLTDTGTVLYARSIPCPGQGSGPCYWSYAPDGTQSYSTILPSSGFSAAHASSSLTNVAFSVSVDRPKDSGLTITTPNGTQMLLPVTSFGFDTLWNLDSLGDFTVCDCISDDYFEAIDVTARQAPEPGSLVLLGTGLLGAVGAARRRLR